MYGTVTPEMVGVIREYVRGRCVWDLGAGDLTYAHHLVRRWGAEKVVAVDKAEMPKIQRRAVFRVQKYFADVQMPQAGVDVAFLSFPQNTSLVGVVRLLGLSKVVIYLGCNTGGTACGDAALFEHLTGREVLAHVPHERGSLVVYGGACAQRPLVPEEWAALHPERMWSFEEAVSSLPET